MVETYFALEMEKLAWRGVYYHGTSPVAEKAILEKGFEASRGGTGGATSLVESAIGPNILTDKFRRNSEGRVALSRSKTVASLYAMAQSPEARARIKAAVKNPTALGRLRGLVSSVRNELSNTQPLEVRGLDEAKLRRDPDHFLLAVQHKGDIPADAVQKSTKGTGLLERLLPNRHPVNTTETPTSAARMTPTGSTPGPSGKAERGRQAAAQAWGEQRLSASKKRTEQMLERQRLSRMEKLAAARWATELRKASPEAAERLTGGMYRLEGVKPPSDVAHRLATRPEKSSDLKEQFIKSLHRLHGTTLPEVAPRFSPEWRAAMHDIKNKNFTRIETGTSLRAAKSTLQHGPSGPADLPKKENMPGLRKWTRATTDQLYASPDFKSVDAKRTAGIYAADSPSSSTGTYARRAGESGPDGHVPDPATLSFDMPASMAKADTGHEYRIPHSAWKWTRNHRIT